MNDTKIETKAPESDVEKGIVVVAYPGMGHEILEQIDDTVIYLNQYNYHDKEDSFDEHWWLRYVDDALSYVNPKLCGDKLYQICFIDPVKDAIDELTQRDEVFIILYPISSKEGIIERLMKIYLETPKRTTALSLADVILNFDDSIEQLSKYKNSIGTANGIIAVAILNDMKNHSIKSRKKIINAFADLKSKPLQGHPTTE